MNINQLIKGIIIGIAKIIPGLSGAVLMISFNLYDRTIDAITHFCGNPKKNMLFLFNLGLGIVLGIVLFSKVIHYFITNYYLYTTSLFLGLIIGGIPVISRKVPKARKYYIYSLVAFSFIFSLSFIGSSKEYVLINNYIDLIIFFISGLLEAVGTILPGVSSTALLMLLGVYNHHLVVLSGALNIYYLKDTLRFLVPFSLGMFLGIIFLSMLINYLFRYYKEETFSLILGISIASVFMLGNTLFPYIISFKDILISIILLIVGYLVTYKLE